MYISKILLNKYILMALFALLWIIGNIIYFSCSLTDLCIFTEINNSNTIEKYLPIKLCRDHKLKGISNIYTKDKIKILVIPPLNQNAKAKYPLVIAFSPAGKTPRKSEIFYNGLTSLANEHGLIVAYVDHIPLSEKHLITLSFSAETIKNHYCIDEKKITYLGHSDGGTLASILSYRDLGIKPKNIIISAAGLNNEGLKNETCPSFRFSTLILHSIKDKLFYGYGLDNYNWLNNCRKCQNNEVKTSKYCKFALECEDINVYCEGTNSHTQWPNNENKNIINFILGKNE